MTRHKCNKNPTSKLSLNDIKDQLQIGEFLIVGDFLENYCFVLQDAAQGFHWNNSQSTIHPFVAYYRTLDATNEKTELHSLSYVIISDCLTHDTVAVYAFQQKLIDHLKQVLPVRKVYYFSDGAASQYKNRKNFLNLAHHFEDFGVEAEWHFFATSHGKGPCDGVGGTVKRLAARASLQRPDAEQLQTPEQLFQWAKSNIPQVTFEYLTQEDIRKVGEELSERLEQSKKVDGTQKLHAFIPINGSSSKVITKPYSRSSKEKTVTVMLTEPRELLNWEQLNGYVTCKYGVDWWVAYLLEQYPNVNEVKLRFMHPSGPSASFKFPSKDDILVVPRDHILSKASPTTAIGRTYQLPEDQMIKASNILQRL